MTSQDPKAAGAASAPRPLRRRADDRVLAGVAGGLADYLNIDPVIVRAVFVGLMIFGGAGLVLYVVAWVLIPAEGSGRSIVEGALARVTSGPAGIALLIVAAIIFIWLALPDSGPFGDGPAYIYFLFGLVTAGVLLLLRGGRSTDAVVDSTHASAVAAEPTEAVLATAPAAVSRRPRAERGPLAWLIVAAVLLAVALLVLVDQATARTVLPGQFLGAVLAVVGLGLVISSWWGNARLLILPALLLAPVAVAASFITVPLEGGTGYSEFTPAGVTEVRDEYRLAFGEMRLDLRELEPAGEPIRIEATIAIGDLDILVPEGSSVDVTGDVGLGGMVLFDSGQSGTSLTNRLVRGDGAGDPDFVLDLGVGIGKIEVWPGDWLDYYHPEHLPGPHDGPAVEATVAPTVPPSPEPSVAPSVAPTVEPTQP